VWDVKDVEDGKDVDGRDLKVVDKCGT